MKEFIVNKKYDNKKLNNFLKEAIPQLPSSTFYKLLRKKDIKINEKRVNENIIVHAGDKIQIYISDDFLSQKQPELEPIFEDENILIINKPQGISVTENSHNEQTLTNLVKQQFGGTLVPCHRLDRNTSGLIIYAKNEEALNILLYKFKNREIEKYYKTTVIGILQKKHDILVSYLFKDSKKSIVYISDTPKKNYTKIITEYTVKSENKAKNLSKLDIILHTGKTHQIRAHLAHIGHPILGDGKYGNNQINKKFGKTMQELSCYKLVFKFSENSGILEYLNNKEFLI